MLLPPVEVVDIVSGDVFTIPFGETVTHLSFFATWCKPCIDELPRLTDLEARWQVEGYSLVLVAVPARQTQLRLAAFARDEQPPGRLVHDSGGKLMQDLGVEQLPCHVLVDSRGKIVHRAPTLRDGVAGEIEKLIRKR